MIFTNETKIAAQKQVFNFLMKKIGSNIVQGKSILNISLPIYIFDTRSNLERFAFSFTFAPEYLEKAANCVDPLLQMKYAISFLLTTTLMYLNLEKPFNPILGETYQGFIAGCPVYLEQISHHPPICAFLLYGRGYKLYGHLESTAKMHANSVDGLNIGDLKV